MASLSAPSSITSRPLRRSIRRVPATVSSWFLADASMSWTAPTPGGRKLLKNTPIQ
jgi:hypothetical protein